MANMAALIVQEMVIIPIFSLECGTTLRDVPVAYKTWGSLNETKDNVMIICHALTGSADVQDWSVTIAFHITISTKCSMSHFLPLVI
jgi:homoserine O-acetyltransferase